MTSPRRQDTIVVDFGYDKMKITDDTLFVREDWSDHFARMVVSCSKYAHGNVGTFSSGNFSDISELTKVNLVSNRWYV